MAKKSFGKLVAFATLSGAVAAGVSYFLKYKSFNKELDQDFHDFEGDGEEDFDGSLPHESAAERNYVPLGEKKPENQPPVKEEKEASEDIPQKAADTTEDTGADAAEDTKKAADTTIIEEDND